MNEVTKINLGRQAFSVANDARQDLQNYLREIEREVGDKDVIDEVEVRMAELLTERGLGEGKVILEKDVDYLKAQLGSPKDFKDDDTEAPESDFVASRRLYRDIDNAMIAGVAAGLAKFFGLDVWIFRILFIILLVVTAGWGVLLYILMWILVPEAKTTSERLQMAGKPVTVDSLKQIAKNADVKGAAKRANASLSGTINQIFNILRKIVGVLMSAFGLSAIFGVLAGLVYYLTKQSVWAKYNIFPRGITEHVLMYEVLAVVVLVAVFIIFFGVAIFRRKWPIRIWVTGTLAGLLILGFAVAGALGASVYPSVRDDYNANLHTLSRNLPPFDSVNIIDGDAEDINFEYASNYYVSINYFGNPNLSNVKTTVSKNSLKIDASQFNWRRDCPVLCVPNKYNLSITVHSPNSDQLQNEEISTPPTPASPIIRPLPMKFWGN